MKFPLTPPKFPEDFHVLHADGGASYWHWHPDAPPDYDGTWPMDQDPPEWAGGLQVGNEDYVTADRTQPGLWIVTWEFGPELETGPWHRCPNDDWDIQTTIDRVISEVNEERQLSSSV